MNGTSLLMLVLAPGAQPEAASAQARAADVITQRTRMPSRYALRYRVDAKHVSRTDPAATTSSRTTYHVWHDGTKHRADGLDAHFTPSRPDYSSHDRRITCENCEREGYVVSTNVKGVPHPPFQIVSFDALAARPIDDFSTKFDWRYFALSNSGRTSYPGLKIAVDFPGFFSSEGVVTKTENRGDLPCLVASRKVVLRSKAVWDQAVWLSARDRFNPIFFEDLYTHEGVPERRTTEVTWQQTPGGHLYPKTVKHNTMIMSDGGKYDSEEVVTFTHADFDTPIDPAVFTLAGLGLNEGQVIGLPGLTHLDRPVWRNGKLDPNYTVRNLESERNPLPPGTTSGPPPPPAPYPTPSNAAWIVGIVAGVAAVVTAVAALVLRRRRAAA